jgi:NADP-dependent 3-hydroxy acid dehydrogenase YdfG
MEGAMKTPAHPALVAGNMAVITGSASGIGLAAAKRFAEYERHEPEMVLRHQTQPSGRR